MASFPLASFAIYIETNQCCEAFLILHIFKIISSDNVHRCFAQRCHGVEKFFDRALKQYIAINTVSCLSILLYPPTLVVQNMHGLSKGSFAGYDRLCPIKRPSQGHVKNGQCPKISNL
jgi:hypothetical protein